MEKTTPEHLRMIADAISARNEALSERDAMKAQVQRFAGELAFVRNEAAAFNTTFSFALERVEAERDAYRAILAGVHGALLDAESIPVPDMGEPLDKAVRALVAERDALQAWKGLSAAACSFLTEQMQVTVARAEPSQPAPLDASRAPVNPDCTIRRMKGTP